MGLAFLITTENLQLLSERKVLKEAEYAALLDASAVVEVAREEANRILHQAMDQAEEARRNGYEEGLQEARAEHAQQLLSDTLASERQLHALRSSMAQIVVGAVEQFMVEVDLGELFEAALLRVDSLIRTESFIVMRVAPEQEDMLRMALANLHDEAQWVATVTVLPDPSLQEGDCVIQTPSGTLEIGVNAQLEAFRNAVERSGAVDSMLAV